jgi:3-hydroxyacyl-CoA dehydrogenase / 3-hydroxy-2-methylbutyryl-CoA dehydrogenase
MKVEETVAVVSGGASGLGEATCRMLVEKGAQVGILDLSEELGEKLVSELGADKAVFCKTDVSDTERVQAAIEKTVAAFGAIHTAVSCAGVPHASKVLTKKGPISMDLFRNVVDINLNGIMNVIRSAAEQMVRNPPNEDGECGVIISTSSGAALFGQIGQAAYSASKAGINGMTLPIARELADHGIRVMSIMPGLFETPMIAGLPEEIKQALIKNIPFPKRMGKPSEFASLCREIIENPMLNGVSIQLDAAYVMQAR